MKVTVQVVFDGNDESTEVREVFALERGAVTPDTLGLRLGEAKDPARRGGLGGWRSRPEARLRSFDRSVSSGRFPNPACLLARHRALHRSGGFV